MDSLKLDNMSREDLLYFRDSNMSLIHKWQRMIRDIDDELHKRRNDNVTSEPIKIGDKVKLNEIGIKAIIDNSSQWTAPTIAKAIAQNNGTITALSLSSSRFVVEFGTATFYVNPEMVDKIGGEL